MKNIAALVMAAGFLASPALAADLPVKAPAFAPPAVYNWSGFYLGASAGAVWNRSEISYAANPLFFTAATPQLNADGSPTLTEAGFTGGLLAGYNLQSGHFVYGLETDFQYTGGSPSQSITRAAAPGLTLGYTVSESVKSDWLWTLRPRLGVTLGASMPSLLYVTGGLAVADVKFTQASIFPNCPCGIGNTESKVKTGWTVGAGWELALSGAWTARAEYLYVDLGKLSFDDNLAVFGFPGATFTHEAKVTEHIARVAVSYRFGAR